MVHFLEWVKIFRGSQSSCDNRRHLQFIDTDGRQPTYFTATENKSLWLQERWALAVSSVKCTEGSSHYHGMEAKCEHCRQDMNLCPNGAFLTLSPSSRSPCTACPEACATLLLVGGGAPPDDYIGDAGIAPSIDTKTSSCYFYGLPRKQSIWQPLLIFSSTRWEGRGLREIRRSVPHAHVSMCL